MNNNLLQLYLKENTGVIIYGAGNAGKQVCDLILSKNKEGVACFIDDSPKKIGKKYKNIKIYSKKTFHHLKKKKLFSRIVIAIPSLDNMKLFKLFNYLYQFSANVYNLPLKSELNLNKINLSDLQKSELVSIFYSNKLKPDKNLIKNLSNKKILITGAGGSIGSELTLQLSRIVSQKIVCLDISELSLFNLKNNIGVNQNKIDLKLGSILDNFLIKKIIKDNKIDIIFHTAAYKHLNFLEKNPIQAIKNNILGTLSLINASLEISKKKIKLINISTDKAVMPKSILGITKRISEIICHSFSHKKNNNIEISTVRFGNVFGSTGSVVNIFLEKINKGEKIEITNKKVKRFFMSVNEACNLVISATSLKHKFATYILDMGKPIKIYSLLKKMIKLKLKKDKNFKIEIKETKLNKGEKLTELLSIDKRLKKTKIKRVLMANEPKYSLNNVDNLIINIQNKINKKNNLEIINDLKKFLSNEIKIK